MQCILCMSRYLYSIQCIYINTLYLIYYIVTISYNLYDIHLIYALNSIELLLK